MGKRQLDDGIFFFIICWIGVSLVMALDEGTWTEWTGEEVNLDPLGAARFFGFLIGCVGFAAVLRGWFGQGRPSILAFTIQGRRLVYGLLYLALSDSIVVVLYYLINNAALGRAVERLYPATLRDTPVGLLIIVLGGVCPMVPAILGWVQLRQVIQRRQPSSPRSPERRGHAD